RAISSTFRARASVFSERSRWNGVTGKPKTPVSLAANCRGVIGNVLSCGNFHGIRKAAALCWSAYAIHREAVGRGSAAGAIGDGRFRGGHHRRMDARGGNAQRDQTIHGGIQAGWEEPDGDRAQPDRGCATYR